MQIYIFKNNEQFGPFDAAQIEDYIKTNVFDINNLAWSEGEAEWIPLSGLLIKQSQTQDVEINVMEAKPAEIQSAPQVAEIKILTINIAKRFLKDNDSIHLGEFTLIEPSAAQVLAKHKGELNLSGLTSLSDKSAMELSKHQGLLVLVNLASLSNTGAEALVQSKWSGNKTSLIASKNVEITLARAKARVEAKAQAQAKAQAKARAHATASAAAESESQANRLENIKNTFLLLFFIVTPIVGIILLCIGFGNIESNSAVNLILTGFICIALPFGGIFVVAAMSGSSDPQTRNTQVAMWQRQQMMNKLDDIRSEFNDE